MLASHAELEMDRIIPLQNVVLLAEIEALQTKCGMLNAGWQVTSECARVSSLELESLRILLSETIEYLDFRVRGKPHSRGFALLQRLNAALIRKD